MYYPTFLFGFLNEWVVINHVLLFFIVILVVFFIFLNSYFKLKSSVFIKFSIFLLLIFWNYSDSTIQSIFYLDFFNFFLFEFTTPF